MKIIFHAHTNKSYDCKLKINQIACRCKKIGIDGVLLTDHNKLSFSGTQKGVKFYPGEEIKTKQGEIIGLFLQKEIEPKQDIKTTINKIKKQGGVVAVPHPFDIFRKTVLERKSLEKNLQQIDIIETYNARNLLKRNNKKAKKFFEDKKEEYNLIEIIGSDAHTLKEYGNTYIEINSFSGPKEFLENLKRAKLKKKNLNIFQKLSSHLITKVTT